MTTIEDRGKYWAILVHQDGKQKAKAYVWRNGLISNLYIRKPYRGDASVAEDLWGGISIFRGLGLFGYASPKGQHMDQQRRDALKRLYRRYGFENISGNKIKYNGRTRF